MPSKRQVERWVDEREDVAARIGDRFHRRERRRHAGRYLRGLISRVERKNGWQLAEELGEELPSTCGISSPAPNGTPISFAMISEAMWSNNWAIPMPS
jgi:hypothetical protein